MKLNFTARSWHKWTSLIVALPILIVAVTAIFISHRKALAIDDMNVAAGWLPGYQAASAQKGRNEARASLISASGETYVGTMSGLYRLTGAQLVAIEELTGTQIRGLAEAPWGRVAAAKGGIWLEQDGKWQRVLKGDAWSAASQPDGSIVVAIRDKGLLASSDGRRWQADAQLAAALAALPAGSEPITLGKLVMDLHTGKALFGKDGEWIWIDLVALSLSLLALTGVYMWWRGQRRRAAQRSAR
jgi:hypothetical protein